MLYNILNITFDCITEIFKQGNRKTMTAEPFNWFYSECGTVSASKSEYQILK